MANFLFCWELGGGLGHTTLFRPFAEALLQRGHRVLVAARELPAARQAFAGTEIPFVAAPCKRGQRKNPVRRPRCFAHILHNTGWDDADELAGRLAAWRHLYDLFEPAAIVCNHSPAALLAARGYPARRVLLGDGFCNPPPTSPLPVVRPWVKHDMRRLTKDEEVVTSVVNKALAQLQVPRVSGLADVYSDADNHLLLTYAELDHFGPREGATYYGTFNTCATGEVDWPSANGPRIFAYLKPMKGLEELLTAISDLGCSAVVHGTWASPMLSAGKGFANVMLEPSPVDLPAAAATCDLAILNATHGSTATFLSAGKPILQIPIVVEQVLTARNTEKLGASLVARNNNLSEITAQLERMLNTDQFTTAAQTFAEKYRNRREQHSQVMKMLLDLIDGA